MNSYFRFKKFTVYQEKCAMKVGTDGVILGAWANITEAGLILDVGTGTGLIALMCAQRSENAYIDAIELDSEAAEQAAENCSDSPWRNRIKVLNDSFQHFASSTDKKYDLILSNPPYFRNSLKPPVKGRSLAKHDDRLNYESLFHHSVTILKKVGSISVIIPSDHVDLLDNIAYFNGLYPVRKTLVRPYEGKDFSRCLIEFSRDSSGICHTNDLTIKNSGSEYTSSFRELTKDFYLKF